MKFSISKQPPIIGTRWLLKKNIEIGEGKLKSLINLYSRLQHGEKIKIIRLPPTYEIYLSPKKKYIRKEIEQYKQRLPMLRKRLKEVM